MIAKIVDGLVQRGMVKIDGKEIALPDTATFVLRLEQTPHGSLKFKVEIEWTRSTEDKEGAQSIPVIE